MTRACRRTCGWWRAPRERLSLKILALALHDTYEASSRYRVAAYGDVLAANDVHVTFAPFYRAGAKGGRLRRWLRGWWQMVVLLWRRAEFDAIWVHRFAVPKLGNQIVSWFDKPIVYDFDDAIWWRDALGAKRTTEFDTLVRAASVIAAGNAFLADEARRCGGRDVRIVPTVVDTTVFVPQPTAREVPIVGWLGSPHTLRYLMQWLPALDELASEHPFVLRIIGAGQPLRLRFAKLDQPQWAAEREASDVAGFDIGLYPLADDAWVQGKCGLKALQYMACGVAFAVSPHGVVREQARHEQEALWVGDLRAQLRRLLTDAALRARLGEAGRARAVEAYSLQHWGGEVVRLFRR